MTVSPKTCRFVASLAVLLFTGMLAAAPQGKFVNPVGLGPEINTTNLDWNPAVSNDELTLYFLSDRSGGLGAWDIYQATRSSMEESFGNVVNLGSVNSNKDDLIGNVSADGRTMYFSSDRAGGMGQEDLYQATRTDTSASFGEVINLGNTLNSTNIDGSPFVSADGLTLYFMSNREGGMDIFSSSRTTPNDNFGPPILVGEVSSSVSEFRPSVSTDGLTLVFSDDLNAPRDGGKGNADIWIASRDSTSQPFGEPVNLSEMWPGSSINTSADEIVPYLSPSWPAAGSKLYYVTDRSRTGDIYEVTWVPSLPGDLDGNGILGGNDVDALSAAIVNGSTLAHFDLDDSGVVDVNDLGYWVQELRGTLLGDANLDGAVNATDLNALALNWQQSSGLWTGGDFTGDGFVNSADLNALALNWRKTANAAVPEPSSISLVLAALSIVAARARRRPCSGGRRKGPLG